MYLKIKMQKSFSKKITGVPDALNEGLRTASGDIIGFLHSDDFFHSNSIISEISSRFENTNCDGVYGDLNYVKSHDISKIVRRLEKQKVLP